MFAVSCSAGCQPTEACLQGSSDAFQGIYDKRQRTEHEMVHREQEIKQLQGWAQTVLNLINKFEDGLKELGPLAAIEEAESRPASPDEDGFPPEEEVPSAAVATARALTSRARDLTAHRQGIAKLRQHFSKVISLLQQSTLFASFDLASIECSMNRFQMIAAVQCPSSCHAFLCVWVHAVPTPTGN